ncbi:membrane protein insertion efficiency factor YidD [Schlegelella koreensis]|uniref:Membrane protein insertion efficiency factor YidD n=1 Tax=Piscinibacter koreensis TaxID=2742824 RepID=A0A7Y6NLH2_9BURK|nr:membrane protein insertion efficiency factor YidD [Schlegelella koreensis]
MRTVVLAAIRAYQRFVSPYKGFCCAYRQHTGRASCSTLGYRVIRRHGVVGGLTLLRQRTYRCGVSHRRFAFRSQRLHPERGVCDCDLPCDSDCDLPSGRGLSKVCDFLSCCDCGGCDWPRRERRDHRRKSMEKEKYVYIPPQRRSPPKRRDGEA